MTSMIKQIIGYVPQLTEARVPGNVRSYSSLTAINSWESMQYLGKVIGVAVALLMVVGSGAWCGFLVGHMFDRARSRRLNLFANQQERQSLFFSTTFEVMGHLTKSKGRVTEADIHVANVLMDRMNLHGASRTAAQQAFRDGKADNYPARENASAAQRLLAVSI